MPRLVQPEEDRPKSSSESSSKGKRKSKPTSKARNAKQKLKDRYAHAREDAQLAGLIPTTPEEALKPEVVSPSVQSEVPQPKLIGECIRNGWAVPEERKPELVDELIAILDNPVIPHKIKVAAFNALRMADQAQYERDHPEEVAKSKGGSGSNVVNVNVVQSNNEAAAVIRGMIENGELGLIPEVSTPTIPSAPSIFRPRGEVQVTSTSESDQQPISECLEDTE